MRRPVLVLTLITLLVPFNATAHPGKTDLYGGHKCFKGCENWGLLYDEYHLHDKDGKPIRVAKKKAPRKLPVTRKAVDEVTPVTQEPMLVTVARHAPTSVVKTGVIPQRESVTLNPLLLVLLALLLLLLLTRMRRRRTNNETMR